jgi:hypothetical protein
MTNSGRHIKLVRHPEKVQIPHIWDWVEDYDYANRYKVGIPRHERHPAWLEAESFYRWILTECENVKHNRDNLQGDRPTKRNG